MPGNSDATSLARHGLSIEQILSLPHPVEEVADGELSDVSILMRNDVRLSRCDAPSVPVAQGRVELIRVERRGDLLTIADVWGQHRGPDGQLVEQAGARLYARKTLALNGADIFMMLNKLPPGVDDDRFFPAAGTAVLFDNADAGLRVLRASGMDCNSGLCQGWIFDAIEV